MIKMKRSLTRRIAAVAIIVLTVAAFIYYYRHHPEVRQQLSQTSLATLAKLLSLYLLSMVALGCVLHATVSLCRVNLNRFETVLVSAYTAVINFFGPLQSGPAFRAVYLKKKYDVNLKTYGLATLVYYFFW